MSPSKQPRGHKTCDRVSEYLYISIYMYLFYIIYIYIYMHMHISMISQGL